MLKLLVMSDIHLGPPGTVRFGMDPAERFAAALRVAGKLHADADLCVFAGDLTDRAEPAAYALFEEMRAGLALPQRVLLGNHDDREVYLRDAVAPMVAETGRVEGVWDGKGHRVVMLDTSEPGRTEGVVPRPSLDWLAGVLEAAGERRVIVVMHHEPAALQMPVDTYRLADPDTLLAVLKASGADIRMVVAGHCHIATAGSWGGIPCATIAGNQHRVAPFLRGRTGQQTSYEGPAQFGVVVSDGHDTVVHFESYVDRNAALPDAMFPWKRDQGFAPDRAD